MLRELRDALAEQGGRPVRVEVLARRLGTDTATLRAVLGHAATRSLVAGAAPVGDVCPPTCAPTATACRHCPLNGAS